jgi:Flp pilus assembly pilin Flp
MFTNALQLLRATLRNRAGVSSLEYGVLAVGIIGAVAAGVALMSTEFTTLFTDIGTAITAAITKVGG